MSFNLLSYDGFPALPWLLEFPCPFTFMPKNILAKN